MNILCVGEGACKYPKSTFTVFRDFEIQLEFGFQYGLAVCYLLSARLAQ